MTSQCRQILISILYVCIITGCPVVAQAKPRDGVFNVLDYSAVGVGALNKTIYFCSVFCPNQTKRKSNPTDKDEDFYN